MHKYLRAIGLSNLKNNLDVIHWINDVVDDALKNNRIITADITDVCEIRIDYSKLFGLAVRGIMDNGKFIVDYYFPYYKGSHYAKLRPFEIEKYTYNESYAGACENLANGISVVFYVNNPINFLDKYNENMFVKFSAMSVSGKIIMPLKKSKRQINISKALSKKRSILINEVKNGDDDAMDELVNDDMFMYSKMAKRFANEDILSVVDTVFMPYGMECDLYSIVGDIISMSEVTNNVTGEIVYNMDIESNGIEYNLGINKEDLLGIPEVGRRFKGEIWLQGTVDFI